MNPPPDVHLLGFPISRVRMAEVTPFILASLAEGQGGWVLTPNLDILRQLSQNPQYAALCRQATLRVADGMPLVWAARLQGTPLPERVAGSDLIWSIAAGAAEAGRTLFFLGGNPGAAEGAIRELRRRHPGLRVAGSECPPLGFERDPAYMAALTNRLRAADPDIVLVALGAPKQDHLIGVLRPALPRAWFLGIGITFSFVSGEVSRAPRWMRQSGLEWVHRLAQEPRRLAKRYLVHGAPFAFRLLSGSFARRFRA